MTQFLSSPDDRQRPSLVWLTFGEVVSRLSGWFGFVYLIHILPPDRFGLIGLAAASVNLLIPFVDLGWSAIGQREVAAHPRHARAWLSAVTVRRSIAAFVLFVSAGIAASYIRDPILGGLVVGNACFILVGAWSPDWYLSGRERFALLGMARLVQSIAYIGLLVAVVHGPQEILLQPIVGVASYVLSWLVMSFGIERKHSIDVNVRIPRSESFTSFAGTYALQNVINISLMAVGMWWGSGAAGIFHVGMRFWLAGTFLAAIPAIVIGPRVARGESGSPELTSAVRTLFSWSLATSTLMVMGGILWGPLATRIVAPESYREASGIVSLLLIASGMQSLSTTATRTLTLRRQTTWAAVSQAIGAITGVIALVVTIPSMGPVSGAIACLTSETVTAFVALTGWSRFKLWPVPAPAEHLRSVLPLVVLGATLSLVLLSAEWNEQLEALMVLAIMGMAWLITLRRSEGIRQVPRIPSARPMKLSAVVVSWNNGPWLLRCVRSLVNSGLPARRITVVETGSDRTALKHVSSLPPGIRVVRRPDNPGYSAAVNAGAEAAVPGDALLVVNADVEFTPAALRTLRDVLADHPRTGCVTVRTHNESGRDTTHVRRTSLLRMSLMMAFPRVWRAMVQVMPTPPTRGRREVRFAEGSAFLVRTSAWHEVDGCDDRFRFFGEDADLSIRLRKAGWKIVHDDTESVLHAGNVSFEKAAIDRIGPMVEGLLLWTWTHRPSRVAMTKRVLMLASKLGGYGQGRGPSGYPFRLGVKDWTAEEPRNSSVRVRSASSRRLTVIIPTYGRNNLLRRVIKNLRPLPTNTQVLVVAQDRRTTVRGDKVVTLHLTRPHRGRSRNFAWRRAVDSILVFCDDDIVPPRGFLQAHRTFHSHGDRRVVTCRMLEPTVGTVRTLQPVLTIAVWGRVYTNFDHPKRVQTGYAATGNMSVTRGTLRATGGFDEAYRGTGAFEDADLGERLNRLGVMSWLEPHPIVRHEPQAGGNFEERRRSTARYFYLFHHNLSYFFLKNRPGWQWPLAGVTALARSLRQTRSTDHPLRSAYFAFQGWWTGRRTYRNLVRP